MKYSVLGTIKVFILALLVSELSGCGSYNQNLLEMRKRQRQHREALVIDMRALKTLPEKRTIHDRRKAVREGKTTLEVIRRETPPEGYADPYRRYHGYYPY